jgi:tellurite resistance-related uncharacterized protein
VSELPPRARVYGATPTFTEETVPSGLLSRHTTKPGVWARIRVLEGALAFRILEPPREELTLAPSRPGIAPPEAPHEVEPRGRVRFFVEFLRDAEEAE